MTHDRDEFALCQAIINAPADDLPRLAYADWLEENGDCDRAQFIRVQLEIDRLVKDGRRLLRGVNREGLFAIERELWVKHSATWYGGSKDCLRLVKIDDDPDDMTVLNFSIDDADATVCRGFVRTIKCNTPTWFGWGKKLCQLHPIEWVVLPREITPQKQRLDNGNTIWRWLRAHTRLPLGDDLQFHLPDFLWNHLTPDLSAREALGWRKDDTFKQPFRAHGYARQYAYYASAESALVDRSRACIRWARHNQSATSST